MERLFPREDKRGNAMKGREKKRKKKKKRKEKEKRKKRGNAMRGGAKCVMYHIRAHTNCNMPYTGAYKL